MGSEGERERMRQIQLRVAEEHAATLKREKAEGTRERIEEEVAREFEAHLAREDADIDVKDPTGRERRAFERKKISRMLGAAFWIALVTLGPEACSHLLHDAAEQAEAERALEKEKGIQAERADSQSVE